MSNIVDATLAPKLFKQSSLSASEVARRAGVPYPTAYHYVCGDSKAPRPEIYMKVIKVLQDDLIQKGNIQQNNTTKFVNSNNRRTTTNTSNQEQLSFSNDLATQLKNKIVGNTFQSGKSEVGTTENTSFTFTPTSTTSTSTSSIYRPVTNNANTYDRTVTYQAPIRGELYFVKNDNAVGSELKGTHPAIVVSNSRINKSCDVVQIVYLTSSFKNPMTTHVKIYVEHDGSSSTALCEQVTTVDKSRLMKYIGKISMAELNMVNKAISIGLCINYGNQVNKSSEESAKQEQQSSTTQTVSLEEYNQKLIETSTLKAERDIYKKFYEDCIKNTLSLKTKVTE